jgi:hypothetical protein
MNPIVKGQLQEFARRNEIEHTPISDQFEQFTIFAVCAGKLSETVDAFEIHLGGNEFGIDGVGILLQGELVTDVTVAEEIIKNTKKPEAEFLFFQSKSSESFDYGDIAKFFDGITQFFTSSGPGPSETLINLQNISNYIFSKASSLRRNPGLRCFYATTGRYESPKVIADMIENRQEHLENLNLFSDIAIQMIGARDLQDMYRAATSAATVEITFDRTVVLPKAHDVKEAYIGFLPGSEILKLFSVYDEDGDTVGINKSVFYDNIRDYDPDSDINKAIKQGDYPLDTRMS